MYGWVVLCGVRWGLDAQVFPMVMKGNFSSQVYLGWDERPPMGRVVASKRLRDEGLHTFLGMVGYCTKDSKEKHFELVHRNVIADDMNEGKMKHVEFEKVGLNNHVSLSHSNILQSAHQHALLRMRKHLGATLANTFT